jgi:predicted Zn-dependent protease
MVDKLERLRALCNADPNNPFAWYTLAMELKKTDPKAALAIFADIHAKHPSYVANYYHYAKTLEEAGDDDHAKVIYRQGMDAARAAGNMHTYGELEAALDLLR